VSGAFLSDPLGMVEIIMSDAAALYRSTGRLGDVVVQHRSKVIAAIAIDARAGIAIGRNLRTFCEKTISRAVEFQAAFRAGAFGEVRRPFVGYLVLLEDSAVSRKPVREAVNFPAFPEFQNASYAERYNILCRKLLMEQFYDAATVILAPRLASGKYSEMSKVTGLRSFVKALAAHIAAEAT